ncbi:MAG TPA: CpXC domain-containing protein [Ktedonobacteraceae bacterium]|nr:CpXC domain-containing protein [Ktedonobacteraceae bacterium]
MSRSTTLRLTCACGEPLTITVYDYVNVAQDPQLRYTVMVGLLNSAVCPMCGRRTALAHPFIYSDPAHQLLAYVHPRGDAPDDARQLILDRLRETYLNIVDNAGSATNGHNHAHMNGVNGAHNGATEIPPLQVIFGIDQLSDVIDAVLSQHERLGKLALSTQSRDTAERAQMLHLARKLALEMQCQVEVEDLPDEYTVWLFGARRQIGAIMRELSPRS